MPPRLKRRGLDVPLSAQPGSGVFSGYASLFNQRDASGDIVMPGAFHQSLLCRPAEDIRMLFQHDPAEPVGAWLEVCETERGLYVLGRLNKNVQRGRELLALLESGGILQLLIKPHAQFFHQGKIACVCAVAIIQPADLVATY